MTASTTENDITQDKTTTTSETPKEGETAQPSETADNNNDNTHSCCDSTDPHSMKTHFAVPAESVLLGIKSFATSAGDTIYHVASSFCSGVHYAISSVGEMTIYGANFALNYSKPCLTMSLDYCSSVINSTIDIGNKTFGCINQGIANRTICIENNIPQNDTSSDGNQTDKSCTSDSVINVLSCEREAFCEHFTIQCDTLNHYSHAVPHWLNDTYHNITSYFGD